MKKNRSKKFYRPGNWPQNGARPWKSDNFMTLKHRQVGCLSRGKRLECWRSLLRFLFGWVKKPLGTWFGPFSESTNYYCSGGFLSRYAQPIWNLSTEHQHSSLLPLDRHPHMPMFRHFEIFTFQWLGPLLRSISWLLKLLEAHFLQFIPYLHSSKIC